jgi:hypothetical protein
MSEAGFEQFGELRSVTRWRLSEIVYCLTNYPQVSQQDAYEMVISSKYLEQLLDENPESLQTESPFYWAMVLAQKGMWWHDEQLTSQSEDYRLNREDHPAKVTVSRVKLVTDYPDLTVRYSPTIRAAASTASSGDATSINCPAFRARSNSTADMVFTLDFYASGTCDPPAIVSGMSIRYQVWYELSDMVLRRRWLMSTSFRNLVVLWVLVLMSGCRASIPLQDCHRAVRLLLLEESAFPSGWSRQEPFHPASHRGAIRRCGVSFTTVGGGAVEEIYEYDDESTGEGGYHRLLELSFTVREEVDTPWETPYPLAEFEPSADRYYLVCSEQGATAMCRYLAQYGPVVTRFNTHMSPDSMTFDSLIQILQTIDDTMVENGSVRN